ncbi:hypothetical protein J6590_018177 [Homalodisca vitripennis]|nr:hypothetical protein J6590_018177 [Homalodisca vitripennis]
MSANPADACGLLDQSIPQWKRELIIRRRALGRTLQVGSSSVKLTCPAVVAIVRQPEGLSAIDGVTNKQLSLPGDVSSSSFSSLNQNSVDFHPSTSSAVAVRNMRLLDASNEVDNLVFSDVEVKNKQGEVNSDICVNYNLIMGEDKSFSSKKKRSTSRSKCDQNNSIKRQQNLFINQVSSGGMNGKSNNDEDGLSDSSEELQYGPGIVNKLKTKYLSMTLREQKRQLRPSIINLRRATSLENMLEGDGNMNKQNKSTEETGLKTENVSVNNKSKTFSNSLGLSSYRAMKYLGNRSLETMKRARSMDTLLKSESRTILKNSLASVDNKHFMNQANDFSKPIASIVNENIIIVENVPVSVPNTDNLNDLIPSNDLSKHLKRNISDEKELPPPDLVKQALKIFETSPKKSLKPASQNNLSKPLVGSSNSNNQAVNNRTTDKGKNNFSKPSLSPKPVLSPERLKQNRTRMTGSPKKSQSSNDTILVNPLQSSKNGQHITKPQLHVDTTESISNVNTNILAKPSKTGITSPKAMSPRSISPVVTVLSNNEQGSSTTVDTRGTSIMDSQNMLQNTDEVEEVDGREFSKSVPEGALENIRRGGVSMQFSFNNENSVHNKSYLPRSKSPAQAVNTSLIKDKLEKSPPASIAPLRSSSSTHTKQVGIIRPLVTSKMQSTHPSSPPLTEQEIEKNLINRVKSIEQPISKVVVAIKAHPDNVVLGTVSPETVANKNLTLPRVSANPKTRTQGLWDDKHWHQNQNTIVFNFSDRKEVPDYIENDGLIFRGIRDRPRGFVIKGKALRI